MAPEILEDSLQNAIDNQDDLMNLHNFQLAA